MTTGETKGGFAKFLDKAKAWFGKAKEKAAPAAEKAWEKTKEVAGEVKEKAAPVAEKAWEKTKEVSEKAWEKTKEVAGDVKEKVGEKIEERKQQGEAPAAPGLPPPRSPSPRRSHPVSPAAAGSSAVGAEGAAHSWPRGCGGDAAAGRRGGQPNNQAPNPEARRHGGLQRVLRRLRSGGRRDGHSVGRVLVGEAQEPGHHPGVSRYIRGCRVFDKACF